MRFFCITCISLIFTLYGFSQESKISGNILNYSGTDSLTIVTFGDQTPLEKKVAVSKKGAFSYTYTGVGTNFSKVYFRPDDFILLVLEPGESVDITANFSNLSQTYTLKGAQHSKIIQKNNQQLLDYVSQIQKQQVDFQRSIDSLEHARIQYIISAITQNPNSLSSLALIDMLDIETYPQVYALLDSALMATYPNNMVVQNFHANLKKMSHLREGTIIPNVELHDENGNLIRLESYRGSTVLLVFWATWCRPCLQEIPHIRDAYRKYNSRGFTVMSVSTDNDKQRWESFVREQPVPWNTTHDTDKTYSQLFQVSGIPFTILIDKDGRIIAKNVRGPALEEHLRRIYP